MPLDELAADLGITRAPDESDEAFTDRLADIVLLLSPAPITADDFATLALEYAGRWASVKVTESERALAIEVRVPWVRSAFGWQRRRLARRVERGLEVHRPINVLITVDVV
jgi:hypothetical protein